MDIFKYLLCTMHNLVAKVRHGELVPLNWTCCSNLQWHWPYNVCISVESSIKKLLWYLSTMQRNYKLVWMLNFTQKKHYLSKSLTIPAYGAMVNRCKVQTTELCICQYNSAPEQGTVGSQPSEGQQKKCLVLKNWWEEDTMRWQADPGQYALRLRPLTLPLPLLRSQDFNQTD